MLFKLERIKELRFLLPKSWLCRISNEWIRHATDFTFLVTTCFLPLPHMIIAWLCLPFFRKAPRICFCWIWVGRGKKFSLVSIWLVLLLSLVTKGATLHLSGCSNFLGLPYKLVQTLWLKKTEIYSHNLESRSLKSRYWRGRVPLRNSSLTLPSNPWHFFGL